MERPQLAGPERPEQMHDLRSGQNARQFQIGGEGDPLARMLLVEVVSRASAGRIEPASRIERDARTTFPCVVFGVGRAR